MTVPTENNESKTVRGTFYETVRMILLAGVGAMSLAQDEVNNFVDRLVERGEIAETDARQLVKEVMDRREKLEEERRVHVRESRAKPVAATRGEVDALNARIAELTRQIEELRQKQEK